MYCTPKILKPGYGPANAFKKNLLLVYWVQEQASSHNGFE